MNRLRQLMPTVLVAVVTAVVVTLLAPPAVQAATRTYVTLRDPANNTATGMAKVVGGKLAVTDGAGALTVDGTVTAKPPARTPFSQECVQPRSDDESWYGGCWIEPPVGKQLVVQSISASMGAPRGVQPPSYLTYLVGGETVRFRLVPVFDSSEDDGFETYLATLTSLDIRPDVGTGMGIAVDRDNGHGGVRAGSLTVNGYLE